MAQLKDSLITGDLRVTGTIYGLGSNLTNINAGNITSGTLPVSRGGTGATTFTSGALLIGNGTSAVSTRTIKNMTAAGNLGWTAAATDIYIPTVNTLAYWNGRYNDSTSNLAYCNKGAFGNAVTYGVDDATANGALGTGTGLTTERSVYYGLVTVNNASQTRATGIYAPTSAGTANQILVSAGGTSAPTWKATANGAAYATSANGALTFGTLPIAQGGTGTATAPTQWGVIYAASTTGYASTSAGTSGYLLQSNATSAPSWIQATNANTASTIVKRDGSGNFSAGTITANLTGTASNATTTADTTNALYPVGVTSGATTTLKRDTSITMTGGAISAASATLSTKLTMTSGKPINQLLTGSGTVGADAGEGVSPRYTPSKWTFNTGANAANGDIFTIKIPCAGHTYGVYISVNNGTNYYPVVHQGTSRITTHYPSGYMITVIFDSSGSAASMTPAAGSNTANADTITGGVFRALNYYDSGNTRNTAGSTNSVSKLFLIGATSQAANPQTYSNNQVYIAAGTSGSTDGYLYARRVYNAVWNDYAEYRLLKEDIETPYGKVLIENGDDSVSVSTKRLQPGAMICSDTFGHCMGEEEHSAPISVAGRVLAYPLEPREQYHFFIGQAVCSGPNGTVSIMTKDEVKEYPECVVGYISAVPQYEEWGQNKIKVDGRIWIKVK